MKKKTSIIIFTIIVFIGTIICFSRGLIYLFKQNNEPLGITWVSLGVAFLAGLVSVISLSISDESKKIAEDSKKQAEDTDDRINEIANTHFLTIISSFENRRLDIQKQISEHNQIQNIVKYNQEQEPKKKMIRLIDNHQLYLWKAVVDLQKAEELTKGKCKIKSEHFNPLMNRFLSLMETINVIKPLLLCESVNNIISIYKIIFEIVPNDTLIETNKISKKSNKETAEDCFRRILDINDNIPINDRLFSLIKKTTGQKNNRRNKFSNYKKQLLEEIKNEKWD